MKPVRFTASYAMLALIILPSGSARAADDCLAAPISQPPQGTHWYYRIDGARQRHCWYLGPEGQKVHHAQPEVQPAAISAAPARTQTAGDRLMASAQVEPPSPPPSPAAVAGATAQAGDQEIAQAARPGTPSIVQWPDPEQPAATDAASGREAGGASTLQDLKAEDEVVRPAAASTANAKTIMPIRVILLVASAFAVAGIFQYAIFRTVIARRRRIYVERGRAKRSVSLAPERIPPASVTSRPNGHAPVEQIDPRDLEEGFRQILQAVERRAAA
jgi:hypothetical protein